MSLAAWFYSRHPRRPGIPRSRLRRPPLRRRALHLEPLEPRLLLSVTPADVLGVVQTVEESPLFEEFLTPILEDGLTYMEPPDWPIPVRQLQGAAMLSLGRLTDAETAFRDDMKKFPDNGWSLSGLQQSLARQKKTSEAAEVGARLEKAWARADK